MDTIQSIIQALLTGLDERHACVYGAATPPGGEPWFRGGTRALELLAAIVI